MSELEKNKDLKFIFTDSYRTKDILWEAYTGYTDSYHNYQMLTSIGVTDPINIATMNKYAQYFYFEIEDYIDDFKDKIKGSEDIMNIFLKSEMSDRDYTTIRKFFATFMKVSGIKNIVKESEDPSDSVSKNR